MQSISDTYFMVKYKFFEKDGIPQYSIVKIEAIINDYCLIEDIKTLKRAWVAKYDIYPINNNNMGGFWEYCKVFDAIIKEKELTCL